MVRSFEGREADPLEAWPVDPERPVRPERVARRRTTFRAAGIVVVLLSSSLGLGLAFRGLGLDESNIVLVFLLGVAGVAFLAGRWASIAASALGVLAFNFFFAHPLHTFAVVDLQYVFTFAVMLVAGITVSELVDRLRREAARSIRQAETNHALFRVGRALTRTTGRQEIAGVAQREIARWMGLEAGVFLTDETSRLALRDDVVGSPGLDLDAREYAAADEALRLGRITGRGTEFHGEATGVYLPLPRADGAPLGVLCVRFDGGASSRRERLMLSAMASQIGLAFAREALAEDAQRVAIDAEAERLRANLLAMVSHDLRTPLAAISGTASTLMERFDLLPADERATLLRDILTESDRLTRMIENLLQLGRMDDGAPRMRKDWYPVDEVIGSALLRLGPSADTERIRVELPPELILIPVDAELISHVVLNLLDNALKYAHSGPIVVAVARTADAVEVSVLDEGPGLPAGSPEHLFVRFARGDASRVRETRGSGLGLAICRSIVDAHGGHIGAENRPGGGARFFFSVPSGDTMDVDVDEPAYGPGR
jgi:two-component system sensor histidine kinase KdpD